MPSEQEGLQKLSRGSYQQYALPERGPAFDRTVMNIRLRHSSKIIKLLPTYKDSKSPRNVYIVVDEKELEDDI